MHLAIRCSETTLACGHAVPVHIDADCSRYQSGGAIVGELPTGAVAGLGARLLAGSYYGQTVQIWAALIAAAIMAGLLVALVGLIARIVNRRMGARPERAAA